MYWELYKVHGAPSKVRRDGMPMYVVVAVVDNAGSESSLKRAS